MRKFFIALLTLALVQPTMVQADDDAEEVTYEDLVNELSRRQRTLTRRSTSPFDDVRIHFGFGMVNSISNFDLGDRRVSRYQNGLQLSAGVDLFSPNWFAETAWRNFGLTRDGREEHTLRELDLKFGYRDEFQSAWSYRLQSGLADRSLKLTDSTKGLDISAQTPHILGSAGVSLRMSPAASLSFDASARSPVISRTADKGSVDFAVDLRVSL